ncbi:DoxX family protein [Nonomuraea sp. NPDC050790]|uniref:DoxX family protein n=1 Tax=Nonomuraea sp. NPDC050790 TaxID=3364371 RepID=UPI0037AE0744
MKLAFDLAALIARVTIGVIFVAHGWQKWQNGLGPTSEMFTRSGVWQPELAAGFTTVAELVGGSFLIIGLLTRLAALALLCVSLGAIIFVHGKNGIFVTNMGWELVGALGAACLLLLAAGAGRISADGIIRTVLRRRAADQTLPESTGSGTTTTMPTNVRTVRETPHTEPPQNGIHPAQNGAPTQNGTPPTPAGTEPRADVPRQSTPPPAPPTSPPAPPATGTTPRATGTTPPATGSGANLSDDDMKALDALMSDDQPRRKPPE